MLIIYLIICLAVNGIFLFLFNDSVVITKNSLLPLMLLFLMIFMGAYQYYNRGKFDFNSNNYSDLSEEEWEKVSIYIFRSLIICAPLNLPFVFFFATYYKFLSILIFLIGFVGGPIYYKLKNK